MQIQDATHVPKKPLLQEACIAARRAAFGTAGMLCTFAGLSRAIAPPNNGLANQPIKDVFGSQGPMHGPYEPWLKHLRRSITSIKPTDILKRITGTPKALFNFFFPKHAYTHTSFFNALTHAEGIYNPFYMAYRNIINLPRVILHNIRASDRSIPIIGDFLKSDKAFNAAAKVSRFFRLVSKEGIRVRPVMVLAASLAALSTVAVHFGKPAIEKLLRKGAPAAAPSAQTTESIVERLIAMVKRNPKTAAVTAGGTLLAGVALKSAFSKEA